MRKAQQQEAAIGYRRTVLQAWHDVVNALVAHRSEESGRRGWRRNILTPGRRWTLRAAAIATA